MELLASQSPLLFLDPRVYAVECVHVHFQPVPYSVIVILAED